MKNYRGNFNFYVYILTNKTRSVLNIGLTNNLKRRLSEHEQKALTMKKHFTGKYDVTFLIYWEHFKYFNRAIDREKELKGLSREKKEKLISQFNEEWKFLNNEIE